MGRDGWITNIAGNECISAMFIHSTKHLIQPASWRSGKVSKLCDDARVRQQRKARVEIIVITTPARIDTNTLLIPFLYLPLA